MIFSPFNKNLFLNGILIDTDTLAIESIEVIRPYFGIVRSNESEIVFHTHALS